MTLRNSRNFCLWVLLLITTGHIIHRLNMKNADYGYKYHKTSESSNGIPREHIRFRLTGSHGVEIGGFDWSVRSSYVEMWEVKIWRA
jgi:hypothetical protein